MGTSRRPNAHVVKDGSNVFDIRRQLAAYPGIWYERLQAAT
jgi:hypothetical protein